MSGTRNNYGNITYNVLEKQQQWDRHLFFFFLELVKLKQDLKKEEEKYI